MKCTVYVIKALKSHFHFVD